MPDPLVMQVIPLQGQAKALLTNCNIRLAKTLPMMKNNAYTILRVFNLQQWQIFMSATDNWPIFYPTDPPQNVPN